MEKERKLEFEHLIMDAEQGDAEAQCELGKFYKLRYGYSEAFEWFKKAANQGNARAQRFLGTCYAEGKGAKKNKQEALFWHLKSAEQGDKYGQYFVACYYSKGQAKNLEESAKWFIKSAENGYSMAQWKLGRCYLCGDGLPQDKEKAVFWFTKGAEQNNSAAQDFLCRCYFFGDGIKRNYKEALHWKIQEYKWSENQGLGSGENNYYVRQFFSSYALYWEHEAKQGNIDAQYHIGHCYLDGSGVKQDYNQAEIWLKKAADQGHVKAKEELDKM